MTYLSQRAWLAGCVVAASALLLTSCTSGDGESKAGQSSPSPAASNPSVQTGPSEKKLTKQAQAALAAVHTGKMVEAGAERVTDGIHTEPSLIKGKTYRLNLVCVGSGSARVVFKPTSTGATTTVPCDQSVVQQRITAQEPIRIDAEGAKGATGVIAWQIDLL